MVASTRQQVSNAAPTAHIALARPAAVVLWEPVFRGHRSRVLPEPARSARRPVKLRGAVRPPTRASSAASVPVPACTGAPVITRSNASTPAWVRSAAVTALPATLVQIAALPLVLFQPHLNPLLRRQLALPALPYLP